MGLGINRTDLNTTGKTYKDGTPVTEPHSFGNAAPPASFGNAIPSDGKNKNTVTWTPSPTHFGNVNP